MLCESWNCLQEEINVLQPHNRQKSSLVNMKQRFIKNAIMKLFSFFFVYRNRKVTALVRKCETQNFKFGFSEDLCNVLGDICIWHDNNWKKSFTLVLWTPLEHFMASWKVYEKSQSGKLIIEECWRKKRVMFREKHSFIHCTEIQSHTTWQWKITRDEHVKKVSETDEVNSL